MAWGAPRGVDDLVTKLRENKTADTMCILSTRRFGPADAVAFSTALACNTSLLELLASGHPLGAAGAAAFGEALSRNTTLRSLCVGDNTFGDEGVVALVEGLRHNNGLVVLDLEYKSVSAGDALGALLKSHPTLADLRLGRNQLGEPGIGALSLGLRRSSTLLRLDLSSNALDTAAAEAIGRALCPPPPSPPTPSGDTDHGGAEGQAGPPPLEFIDVSKNPLGDEGGAALLRAFASGVGASLTLRGLKMAEAGLGIATAAALADAIAPTGTSSGAASVVSEDGEDGEGGGGGGGGGSENSLVSSSNARALPLLKTLDMSKNELGAGGAARVGDALSRGGAPQLESLSMGYNGVGDEGAAALGRSAHAGLRVLDLSGNDLSGEGIKAVLSSRGLREAKLFHNACGDEGVPMVLEALISGGVLETLDLGANGITGIGFDNLLPGLTSCSSLKTLEVGANSNDDRAEAAVRLSQANNPGLDIAFRRGGEAMEGSGAPLAAGLGSPGPSD